MWGGGEPGRRGKLDGATGNPKPSGAGEDQKGMLMKELEYMTPYRLEDLIIKIVQEGYIKDNFCLYTKEYEAIATLELTCYLERYPEVSDDDEEVYPDYVEQNELELFFYGDQFMDVLRSALNQKPSATVDELISALNYYLENDAFITFS